MVLKSCYGVSSGTATFYQLNFWLGKLLCKSNRLNGACLSALIVVNVFADNSSRMVSFRFDYAKIVAIDKDSSVFYRLDNYCRFV
jgi:hypothetical protein